VYGGQVQMGMASGYPAIPTGIAVVKHGKLKKMKGEFFLAMASFCLWQIEIVWNCEITVMLRAGFKQPKFKHGKMKFKGFKWASLVAHVVWKHNSK
jgi:hypothetical protein